MAQLVQCARCGAYVNKEDAFLDCDGPYSRPMWLCANCDMQATIEKLDNYGRF